MALPEWERLADEGYFNRDVAEYLAQDIDDPYSIERVEASWDGAAWTIEIDHGDFTTEYVFHDRELPDWWWEDLYEWADEIGALWELVYEEKAG